MHLIQNENKCPLLPAAYSKSKGSPDVSFLTNAPLNSFLNRTANLSNCSNGTYIPKGFSKENKTFLVLPSEMLRKILKYKQSLLLQHNPLGVWRFDLRSCCADAYQGPQDGFTNGKYTHVTRIWCCFSSNTSWGAKWLGSGLYNCLVGLSLWPPCRIHLQVQKQVTQ